MTPDRMIEARKALEFTQTDMANMLAVNRRQQQRWEAGSLPIPERVSDVVEFLAFGKWPRNWPDDCPGRQAVK